MAQKRKKTDGERKDDDGRRRGRVENGNRDEFAAYEPHGGISRDEFDVRKAQLEDIQARAYEIGDLRAELAAIQEINKLCGLYAESFNAEKSNVDEIVRTHLEGTGVVEKGLPLEELARRIAIVVATNIDALKNAYD